MAEPTNNNGELTPDELEAQHAEPLPDREAMSLIEPSPLRPLPLDPNLPPTDPGPEAL